MLKIGDIVLVERKAESHERGWRNTWEKGMDSVVGKTGVVIRYNKLHRNVHIKVDGNIEGYGYPDFVLRIFKDAAGMRITKIKRAGGRSGLKIYAEVSGAHGKNYLVGYFRRNNFRGWQCTCKNFFFDAFKKNRNCKHIKLVRAETGRYGGGVPE